MTGDDLVAAATGTLATTHAQMVADVRGHIEDARSSRTRALYAKAWAAFEAWCKRQKHASLPALPAVVAGYLSHLYDDGHKASTIDLALVTICVRHRAAGHPSPRDHEVVRLAREGIRRKIGVKPRQVAPLVVEELEQVIRYLPDTLAGARDRALLLVGWAGALRESELVALDVQDLAIRGAKMVIAIERSKTDQVAEGATVGFRAAERPALCPIAAVRRWMKLAEIRDGAIFRAVDRWEHIADRRLSTRSIDLIVKRAVTVAGYDGEAYAGHSLRAGLATSAANAGKSLDAIMRQTRHKSVEVARRYIRRADLFKDNAVDGLL